MGPLAPLVSPDTGLRPCPSSTSHRKNVQAYRLQFVPPYPQTADEPGTDTDTSSHYKHPLETGDEYKLGGTAALRIVQSPHGDEDT